MTDRFSEIEKPFRSQPGLEARLKEYPELRAKIETLLSIIENAGGDVEKASQAEQRIIEEMRQMGHEVLHGWARRQQQKKEEECDAKPGIHRKEKKPLLVHPTRKNRNRGAGLHPRPTGAGDSPLFRIGGSAVSGVLEGAATSHRRFWGG